MKPIIAYINMRPHLAKWVHYMCNLAEGEHVSLRGGGLIGYLIKEQLTTKAVIFDEEPLKRNPYTSRVSFLVDKTQYRSGRIFMSRRGTRYVNAILHRMMVEYLQMQILTLGQLHGMQARQVIEWFMEQTGIDYDDIEYDSLKKANYRLMKERDYMDIRKIRQNASIK